MWVVLTDSWTGWAARRGPGSPFVNFGLFRAASLRTQRAPFSALGSPAIYAAFVTGVAWMAWWRAGRPRGSYAACWPSQPPTRAGRVLVSPAGRAWRPG